jgi:Fe-S cluster assembly protein SufD
MSEVQSYLELYSAHRDTLLAHTPEVMNSVRDAAIAVVGQKGFPSQKVEEYKYIDVEKALGGVYKYSVTSSQINKKDDVVEVNNDALMNTHYAKVADINDPIAALNTAFANECLCIHVGKNQVVDKPIEISDVLKSSEPLMEHKRVLVVLDENASATILFRYVAQDKVKFLTTQVVEVVVGENAHLDMYEIEETHTSCTRFNNVYFNVDRYATVRHNNITIFNGMTRNTIRVGLKGEYSEVVLNGCAMTDKKQMVDNNTVIRHEAPNCTSNELYKYVVDEQSTGAFAGMVYVAEGAQKTISEEVNQNICLSDDARMFTQPMLEIYADDVKCSHGSTVGKLDEASLFYMRQRGIPLDEVKMLLVQAFISQVVDMIPLEPLRQRLDILVEQRLKGELDKCTGCALCKQ